MKKREFVRPKVIVKKGFEVKIKDNYELFSDLNVLAVDPNPLNLNYYNTLFKNIQSFSDPQEALFETKKTKYDIIILEYYFSKYTGKELLSKIRKNEINNDIFSLLITGEDNNLHKEKLAFFDDYLFKPTTPKMIYSILSDLK